MRFSSKKCTQFFCGVTCINSGGMDLEIGGSPFLVKNKRAIGQFFVKKQIHFLPEAVLSIQNADRQPYRQRGRLSEVVLLISLCSNYA